METILQEIKKRCPEANVLCLCKTGSSLFCDNCRDTDIMAICDGVSFTSSFFKLYDLNTDIFCHSKLSALKTASGQNRIYGLTLALATGENLLYGQLPFEDYSWDKYKANVLKAEYDRFRKMLFHRAQRLGVCDKSMVWTFATYFAYNSLEFTAEQREILQKCHDLDLPVSYAEELKLKIEKRLII